MSHALVPAGLPLVNLSIALASNSTHTLVETLAPSPTTSPPVSTPPQCYDGLHDDLPLGSRSPTRTATGTTTALNANSPGLLMRYFLVSMAFALTLADRLVHAPILDCAFICVLGLVCISWVSCHYAGAESEVWKALPCLADGSQPTFAVFRTQVTGCYPHLNKDTHYPL